MNIYLLIAGALGFLGSIAHTILGHIWTVAPLPEDHIGTAQNTGDQNKRFLTWFWHIGSFVLASSSALFFLDGVGAVSLHEQLLWYLSSLWLAITVIFAVIAVRPPSQLLAMVPGLVGIPVNALILLGLLT